ncbi:hypothetical protein EYS14_09050 [Alteromonadaceae bacterium M269]|nr:hypothetical protein EYS14_09050 [Alteromonadaceae bacterium M269]
MLQLVGRFLTAVLVTYVLASLFHTYFVLNGLEDVGTEITLSTRVTTSISDIFGLFAYAGIIAAGLLIGFSVMGLIRKFYKLLPRWVYPLAGLLTMICIHLAMFPIFEVTLIAGARSTLGFAAQCVAGIIGGWVFAPKASKDTMFS